MVSVIIKAVEQRKEYIDHSRIGRQANEQLAGIQAESEKILAQAREQQNEILKQALAEKEQIISAARQRHPLRHLQLEEATRRIGEERTKPSAKSAPKSPTCQSPLQRK